MSLLVRENVIETIQTLNDTQLNEVAEYLAFLKFRSRRSSRPSLDTKQVAALYAEFADEDRKLAEQGISDYYDGLIKVQKKA